MSPITPTTEVTKFDKIDVELHGDKIVLPEGMSWDEGIVWLQRKKEEAEREVAISAAVTGFHVLDAAHAFNLALSTLYGWTALVPTPGFFGPTPPTFLQVVIDSAGNSVQVPWGSIKVPRVAGRLETGFHPSATGEVCFHIGGKTKQKDMPQVQRIVDKTKELLRTHSIYRGKAIRVEFDDDNPLKAPSFMDLSGIRREGLVFSKATEKLIDITLWTPLQQAARARGLGVPLKRGFLLEGPYGVGKTLCARVTAELATRHGWTFLYIEKIKDLKRALDFARMYQPAVVFAEDVDRVDDGTRNDPFNELLNMIDGVEYKTAELFTILTTNHVDRLHKSMLRPGRLDVVLEVREPDADAASRLLALYAGNLLDPQTDLTEAGKLFAGHSPAILNEVVQRAKLAHMQRVVDTNEAILLSGLDFEAAILSLKPQLDLLKGDVAKTVPPISHALEQVGAAMTAPLESRIKLIEEKLS